MFACVKNFISNAVDHFTEGPSSMLKAFLAAVLVQFSILSFLSITVPDQVAALPTLRAIMTTAEYWWGWVSAFGALFLLLETKVKDWVLGQALGYGASLVSFGVLLYDFMFHRPPIYAGGVLAATASIFIGGLLYDRLRRG